MHMSVRQIQSVLAAELRDKHPGGAPHRGVHQALAPHQASPGNARLAVATRPSSR
jgi:hypothetical protein